MIAYSMGAYDILREKDLQEIDKQIQLSKEHGTQLFAIGIYEDELCQMLGLNKPLKKIEDRLKIMENIRGVDFTFSINSLDTNLIKERLKKAYKKFSENNKTQKDFGNKKYELSYAPGTYDLFHAGHLENLLIASGQSEKLIVGVKADELVQEHKKRQPAILAEERMAILRHFKFVDDVYIYYTRDLQIANDYIKSKYDRDVDAVFLGSDLKNDFKDVKNINIVYTERDAELMKERSTSSYLKKYKLLSLNTEKTEKKLKGNVRKAQDKNNVNENCYSNWNEQEI